LDTITSLILLMLTMLPSLRLISSKEISMGHGEAQRFTRTARQRRRRRRRWWWWWRTCVKNGV